MEKKYKLREEVLQQLVGILSCKLLDQLRNREQSKSEWYNENFESNTLEEVEQRVELKYKPTHQNFWLGFYGSRQWTPKEKDLCEAILNASEQTQQAVLSGFDDFCVNLLEYYEDNYCNPAKGVMYIDVLKQYLKEL